MRRRDFIAGIVGSAAWPLVVRAQQPAMPVIGFLHTGSPAPYAHLMAAFRQGLNELGYVEGRNVGIEYRWAEGQPNRIPAMAADLVRRQVNVIAVAGASGSVGAAKAATSTIPIVFSIGSDPVTLGYVASLNRPGGNITGVSFLGTELEEKQLHLLKELMPKVDTIGFLMNPNTVNAAYILQNARVAASKLDRQLQVLNASNDRDLDHAFAALAPKRVGALLVTIDALMIINREKIVALAASHAIPTIYGLREFAVAGGLLSYGASLPVIYRQHGAYVGRVMRGEKPADLPVMQPTKFEFVLNLKTAKTLGLEILPTLLALADEVIE